MSIVNGYKKVKRYIQTDNGHELMSQWTNSDTVEANGKTLTEALTTKADLDSSGKVKLEQMPKVALDNLVKVENDTARFALTTDDVQTGDTVKVLESDDGSGERMYLVVDDTKLNSEDGYTGYSATTTWETIEGKPDNLVYADDSGESTNIETPIELTRNDIADNLSTYDNTKVLSAYQGGVLNSKCSDLGKILGDVAEYSEDSTYAVGDYCLYTDQLFRCHTAITIPIAFDGSSHWTATTFKDDINELNSKLIKMENVVLKYTIKSENVDTGVIQLPPSYLANNGKYAVCLGVRNGEHIYKFYYQQQLYLRIEDMTLDREVVIEFLVFY